MEGTQIKKNIPMITYGENAMPELEKALTRPPNPPVILPNKKLQALKRPMPRKKAPYLKRQKKSVLIGSMNERVSSSGFQNPRDDQIMTTHGDIIMKSSPSPTMPTLSPYGSHQGSTSNPVGRPPSGSNITAKKTQSVRKTQPAKVNLGSRLAMMANISPANSLRSASSYSSPIADGIATDPYVLSDYICKKSGLSKPVKQSVLTEHTYSKPHNWLPEHTHMRPVRYLFTETPSDIKKQFKMDALQSDEMIDIELVDGEILMPGSESWRTGASWHSNDDSAHVKSKGEASMKVEEDDSNWEEKISREGWSSGQTRLFNNVSSTLDSLELRSLVCAGSTSEGATMRTAYDMHANDLRYHLINCNHDLRVPIWLHLLLVERLPPHLKHHYKQLLARVRKAVPGIVDVMVKTLAPFGTMGRAASGTNTSPNIELPALQPDPVAEQLVREKFKRLPHSPVFLVIPDDHRMHRQPRFNLFTTMLHQMGATVTVPLTQAPDGSSVAAGLELKMTEVRRQLGELRSKTGNSRDIVLVGFNTGAAVAVQVALVEQASVYALVCLGFPAVTLGGARGQPDDMILNVKAPTLFCSGEHDITSSVPVLEAMRSRMDVYTQLVVIGSADDRLIVPRHKLINMDLTQAMVDKAILVEIHNFIGGLLTNPPGAAAHTSKLHPAKRASVDEAKATTRRYIKKQNKNIPGNVTSKIIAHCSVLTPLASADLADGKTQLDITLETPSMRRARLMAAQQQLLTAKFSEPSVESPGVVPGLWQSKYKSPMLSPVPDRTRPQQRIASAPPSPTTLPSYAPMATPLTVFATPLVPRSTASPMVAATAPSTGPITASLLPAGCYPLDPTSKLLKVLTSRPRPVMSPTKVVMLGDNPLNVTSKIVKINQKYAPLTADNILSLPIIFAKDDDNIFQLGKAKTDGPSTSSSLTEEEMEVTEGDVKMPLMDSDNIVNKFEFSKPQPGVKYRKIILTRMNQTSGGVAEGAGSSMTTHAANNPKLLGSVKHGAKGKSNARRKNFIIEHQEHDYE